VQGRYLYHFRQNQVEWLNKADMSLRLNDDACWFLTLTEPKPTMWLALET
jgi:hypothetical protein